MKLFRLIVISLILCMLTVSPALAASPKHHIAGENVIDTKVVDYSREEFIARLAEIKGTDLHTAESYVRQLEQESPSLSEPHVTAATSSDSYHEFLAHHDFGCGTTVEAGVLFIVRYYVTPPSTSIVGIAATWTSPYSSGPYTWSESYHIVDWDDQSIMQTARGYVEYAVDVSVDGGVEFKNELIGAGFSVNVVVGTTYYLRKTATWSASFSLNI